MRTIQHILPIITSKDLVNVPIEGGKPFPGFAWRNTPQLNINGIWLYRYMSRPEQGTSKVWWDHLVVAKKYIGPLTPVRPIR